MHVRTLAWLVAALSIAAAGAGCGSSTDSSTRSVVSTVKPSAAPYSLSRTRRCLRARGDRVGPVTSRDRRVQALRAGAQHTSFEVVVGGGQVALAITGQAADAGLLVELLQPLAPYRVMTRGNAVLLYRFSARPAAAAVRACLR